MSTKRLSECYEAIAVAEVELSEAKEEHLREFRAALVDLLNSFNVSICAGGYEGSRIELEHRPEGSRPFTVEDLDF